MEKDFKLILSIEQNPARWFEDNEILALFINKSIKWLEEGGNELHWPAIQKGIGMGDVQVSKPNRFYDNVENLIRQNGEEVVRDSSGRRRILATLAKKAGFPPGLDYSGLIREILKHSSWQEIAADPESEIKYNVDIVRERLSFTQKKLLDTEEGISSLAELFKILCFVKDYPEQVNSARVIELIEKEFILGKAVAEKISENYKSFIFNPKDEEYQPFIADLALDLTDYSIGIRTNISRKGVAIKAECPQNPKIKTNIKTEVIGKLFFDNDILKSDHEDGLFLKMDFKELLKYSENNRQIQIILTTGNRTEHYEYLLTEIDNLEKLIVFNSEGKIILTSHYNAYKNEKVFFLPLKEEIYNILIKKHPNRLKKNENSLPVFELSIADSVEECISFSDVEIYFSDIKTDFEWPAEIKVSRIKFCNRVFSVDKSDFVKIKSTEKVNYIIKKNDVVQSKGEIDKNGIIKIPGFVGEYTLEIFTNGTKIIRRNFAVIPDYFLCIDWDNRRFKIIEKSAKKASVILENFNRKDDWYSLKEKEINEGEFEITDSSGCSFTLIAEVDLRHPVSMYCCNRKIQSGEKISFDKFSVDSFINIPEPTGKIILKLCCHPVGFQFTKLLQNNYRNYKKLFLADIYQEIKKSKSIKFDITVYMENFNYSFQIEKERYCLKYDRENKLFEFEDNIKDLCKIRYINILGDFNSFELDPDECFETKNSIYLVYLVKDGCIVSDRIFINNNPPLTDDNIINALIELDPNSNKSFMNLCRILLEEDYYFDEYKSLRIENWFKEIIENSVPDDVLIFSLLPQYCTLLPFWWRMLRRYLLKGQVQDDCILEDDIFCENGRFLWELITVEDIKKLSDKIFSKNIFIGAFQTEILNFSCPEDELALLFAKYAWIKIYNETSHSAISEFEKKYLIEFHRNDNNKSLMDYLHSLLAPEKEEAEKGYREFSDFIRFYPRIAEKDIEKDIILYSEKNLKEENFMEKHDIKYLGEDFLENCLYCQIKKMRENLMERNLSVSPWVDEGNRLFNPKDTNLLKNKLMYFLNYVHLRYIDSELNRLVKPFSNILMTAKNSKLKEKTSEVFVSLTAYLSVYRQINGRHCERYFSYDILIFSLKMIKEQEPKIFNSWHNQWMIRLIEEKKANKESN